METASRLVRPAWRSAGGGSGWRRLWLLSAGLWATGLAVWTTVLAGTIGLSWAGPDEQFTFVVTLAAFVLVGCGLLLWGWRPTNRTSQVMFTLSGLLSAWLLSLGTPNQVVGVIGSVLVLGFRPLLFFIVLGWPSGRIGRPDRLWLTAYTAALSFCWLPWLLVDPHVPEPLPCHAYTTSSVPCSRNPLALAHLAGLGAGLVSIGTYVVVPGGAIVVLVTVLRRFHRLPLAVRRLAMQALMAGCLAAVGDVLLNLTDIFGPSSNDNLVDIVGSRRALGGLVGLFDTGRYLTVPVILVWAAWRSRRRLDHMDEVRTVEVGRAVTPLGLRDSIAVALDDPAAQVAFRRGDSGWVDARGGQLSFGQAGRSVTIIERDGKPIAAIEHHGSRDDWASTLDAAVAAAGATIDYERLRALARSRQAEALQARQAIIELEDAARRRLERDLHDGAQQRLVGLALHASLAERAGGDDGIEVLLAEGVATARAELRSLLEGLPPVILAERGLEVALCTLAATVPLEVEIDVVVPADLPARATTTAWFVVAEAVANAIKHANARRLRVVGGVDGARLRVAVADDGMGGADETAGSGLTSLRARAISLGGSLAVDSAPGAGTTVRLDIPVGQDP